MTFLVCRVSSKCSLCKSNLSLCARYETLAACITDKTFTQFVFLVLQRNKQLLSKDKLKLMTHFAREQRCGPLQVFFSVIMSVLSDVVFLCKSVTSAKREVIFFCKLASVFFSVIRE